MKRTLLAIALSAVAAQSAYATIAPPASGNGELFLSVSNTVVQVSYTLDLGIFMDDFLANGNTVGYAPSFNVAADPNWQAFLTATGGSLANAEWVVMATDGTGGSQPERHRALITARQLVDPATTIAQIRTTTNFGFSAMVNGSSTLDFYNAVNQTGTHGAVGVAPDFSVNGSSLNRATDERPNAYFGQPNALNATFNSFARFNATNVVNESTTSGFYYLYRSSSLNGNNNLITVVPFQSTDGVLATWEFDGNTLAYAVPEPSTYALLVAGLIGIGVLVRRRQA
jgi:hypothetical protein